MKFNINKTGGVKVLFATKGEKLKDEIFIWAKEHEDFKGEYKQIVYFPSLKTSGTLLVGLGEIEKLTQEKLIELFFDVAKTLKAKKEATVEIKMIDLNRCNRKTLMGVYEGFRQAEYSFTKQTKDKKEDFELTVNYTAFKGPEEKLKAGLKRMQDQMDGVFLARDLVNETANEIYPESLAKAAKKALEELGVKVTIYNEQEIKKIGMEAFLAVARGSEKEPRLIVMEYVGDTKSEFVTGLVGKGVTYDSGGYCIKPASYMNGMHSDMGGAATVIGTIYALAKSKATVNVIGVIAACENMISGDAYKTGDIISSMSGKTIEVVNTDAEGRLTLADAVYYTSNNLKVNQLIDLATLTGAVLVALGEEYTAAITNNSKLMESFKNATEDASEKVWELPNDSRLRELNKSTFADIKNSGSRNAGTITAGQFIQEFLAKDIPWLHLDIAGTAYLEKAKGFLPERATGIHVKSLYNLLNPLDAC